MSKLKLKDIKTMSDKDREDKIKELRMELIRREIGKEVKVKAKEIKKTIARILTFSKK